MKNLKKAVTVILSAVLMVIATFSALADYDISVRMDSIISEDTHYVTFTRMKPIQIDNRTLTPARDMAESAGMQVEWDQPTQTAILTLKADANSDKPIERFAAELFHNIVGFGLDLTPVSITAALKLNESNAVIRYNYADTEGDIVPVGKKYEMVSKAIFIEDGTLMIPIRDSMEMFGLDVDWNQEELCAIVSIPDIADVHSDISIIPNHGEGEFAATPTPAPTPAPTEPAVDTPQLGTYIGNFKITHYCPCSICNGGWGAYTAWAGELTPGRSIAVNPNTIPKLSWVYIDGYGVRRAEDTGSGIGEYHIDMAVPSHAMAIKLGVVYKDVYFTEAPAGY